MRKDWLKYPHSDSTDMENRKTAGDDQISTEYHSTFWDTEMVERSKPNINQSFACLYKMMSSFPNHTPTCRRTNTNAMELRTMVSVGKESLVAL